MSSDRFWRGLSTTSTLRDVPRHWLNVFGEAYEAATAFLDPVGDAVARFPCVAPCGRGCRMHVLSSNETHTAYCPRTPQEAPDCPLSQDEVIVYAFNVTRLCKAIAKALEINSPQRLDQILDNAWHIGTLNLPKGKSAPVYFAIQQTFIPLGNTIEKLLLRGKEPPVILIPTMTLCPVEIRGVAEDKMGHVLGLDQIVTIQPKGKAHAPLPLIQVVMSRLGDTNPPYMFMLIDDHYFLRWDGSEVAQIDRSKGFDYYRTLLQCPCTNMSALDLQTKFPDKKKKLRPLGGIDVSDDTAIKDQENELRDLMQELEKAEANGDFATRDRIKEEIAQVQGHMQRSRNIGGRPRKSLDPEEQARKNVSRAMKRALDQIPDSLAPLKEHLMKSISPSVTLRYEPPVDIPWNL